MSSSLKYLWCPNKHFIFATSLTLRIMFVKCSYFVWACLVLTDFWLRGSLEPFYAIMKTNMNSFFLFYHLCSRTKACSSHWEAFIINLTYFCRRYVSSTLTSCSHSITGSTVWVLELIVLGSVWKENWIYSSQKIAKTRIVVRAAQRR